MANNEIQFILYNMPDDEGKVQVVIKDETLWCTQKAMAQLFGVGVPAISKHLSHIFEEEELDKDATLSKMEIVVNRGFRGEVPEEVEFYNLDAIIAVGYRVSSLKAITTATNLTQYLVCFICALFRVVKTEEPYGRIEHFHRLLKGYLKKLPAVRTLQSGVQWLKDKTKTFFRCAKRQAEEAKHIAWETLEEIIFGHIGNLAPQYAAM